ncbi:FG-GAP repeat domain-containing protein [Fodinibius sp.]|uniref:FG-GAP repeat domain-containing protein n=1 Tax=Fodinibius sp. TaxID=1872440 RepID=UPI003565F04A
MVVCKTLVNSTGIFWVIVLLFAGCTTSADLEWHGEEGYRWAELSPAFFGSTGFQKLDSTDTGIRFRNFVSEERIEENRNFLNGSGVATADVDGDGRVDIYLARLEGPNKLYRNLGSFEFEDITEEANLAHEGYHSTGVVFADVNGDSHPDLLVTSLAQGNELYINDGEGRFALKGDSGLGPSNGSNTMTLADIDKDGDLDLYITNYKLKTVRDIYSAEELSTENTVRREGDSLVVVPPFDKYYGIIETEGQSYRNEYGTKDELYINGGEGAFRKVDNDKDYFMAADGSEQGLSRDWGLTAKFQDVNGDGYPDLYVANDFWTPDRMWMNRGDGTFRSIDRNAIRNMSFSAMGVDFSDINRDGAVDIFVTEMLSGNHQRRLRQLSEHLDPIEGRPQYNRNSLYLNRGDHTFAEISNYGNVTATEWSWATNFLDIDLDG